MQTQIRNPRETAATSPCCCCREVPHAGHPDRDLEGYLCHVCALWARRAELALKAAGIEGITRKQP